MSDVDSYHYDCGTLYVMRTRLTDSESLIRNLQGSVQCRSLLLLPGPLPDRTGMRAAALGLVLDPAACVRLPRRAQKGLLSIECRFTKWRFVIK